MSESTLTDNVWSKPQGTRSIIQFKHLCQVVSIYGQSLLCICDILWILWVNKMEYTVNICLVPPKLYDQAT